MMNYTVLLLDKITRETEKIDVIKTDNEENLKQHLLDLQKGYCEDEKPTVCKEVVIDKNNFKIEIMIAESDSDYSYIVPLKKII